MSTAFLVALRRLRAPIILLVLLFAVGIVGLVLIPGTDAVGRPWRMTIFDALYFMSYTASTIGFGEIPHAFNTAQRVWVTLIIYASVISWAYLVANLLTLGFFLTPLFIISAMLVGLGAVLLLPREEEPQIVVPMIDVFVQMPGATPREIESRVTTARRSPVAMSLPESDEIVSISGRVRGAPAQT